MQRYEIFHHYYTLNGKIFITSKTIRLDYSTWAIKYHGAKLLFHPESCFIFGMNDRNLV
jgi:hypothetical protein